jgi:hypothetical protein
MKTNMPLYKITVRAEILVNAKGQRPPQYFTTQDDGLLYRRLKKFYNTQSNPNGKFQNVALTLTPSTLNKIINEIDACRESPQRTRVLGFLSAVRRQVKQGRIIFAKVSIVNQFKSPKKPRKRQWPGMRPTHPKVATWGKFMRPYSNPLPSSLSAPN